MDKSNLLFALAVIVWTLYLIMRIGYGNHLAFGLTMTLMFFGMGIGAACSLIVISWRMSPKQVLKKGLPHY